MKFLVVRLYPDAFKESAKNIYYYKMRKCFNDYSFYDDYSLPYKVTNLFINMRTTAI